jgi:YD repeat-containing protein
MELKKRKFIRIFSYDESGQLGSIFSNWVDVVTMGF